MKQLKIVDYFGKTCCELCKKPTLKNETICSVCIEKVKKIAERKERRELRVSGSDCWRVWA